MTQRNEQEECDFSPQKKLCESWSGSVRRKHNSLAQPAGPSSIMGIVVDVKWNRMSVSSTYFSNQTQKHAVLAIKRSAVGCFCWKDANYIPDNQELWLPHEERIKCLESQAERAAGAAGTPTRNSCLSNNTKLWASKKSRHWKQKLKKSWD